MIVKQEIRQYEAGTSVWVGKYQNLHNLPHWHVDHEILYIEEGSIRLFCNGKTYDAKKGDCIFINSRDVHAVDGSKDSVVCVLIFTEEIAKSVAGAHYIAPPLLKGTYDIPSCYQTIKEELSAKRPFYAQAIEVTIARLLIEIYRFEAIEERELSVGFKDIDDLLKEIDQNYAYYTFDDAVSFMNLNKTYFSALFHKCVGMTFSQYLNRVRIEKAIDLLQSGKNVKITTVAIDCGFYSLRNFNRIFKSITNYTPKQLPKNYRLEKIQYYKLSDSFNPMGQSSIPFDLEHCGEESSSLRHIS